VVLDSFCPPVKLPIETGIGIERHLSGQRRVVLTAFLIGLHWCSHAIKTIFEIGTRY